MSEQETKEATSWNIVIYIPADTVVAQEIIHLHNYTYNYRHRFATTIQLLPQLANVPSGILGNWLTITNIYIICQWLL